MKTLFLMLLIAFAAHVNAQSLTDETAIQKIIEDENATWKSGDSVGYSRHFAETGTFTNIRGQFFIGHSAFLRQHELIFNGMFKNTTVSQDIVSLKFIRPDVAIVETLTAVVGIPEGTAGITRDEKGRLRTRLLQVVSKENGVWKIIAYHNVDLKPGIPVPEPK